MNRTSGYRIVFFTLFLLCVSIVSNTKSLAQSGAGDYMQGINESYSDIEKDTWNYIKVALRGKSANKVDKKREQLLSTIEATSRKIRKMKTFNGDASYRDAAVKYLNLKYDILNNDFSKIVDMEAIAEESYDNMEAYLLAKERANAKLDLAFNELVKEQQSFAEKHNINLVDSDSKRSKKLEEAGEVINYYNKVFLIFFKSAKQEEYLRKAIVQEDVNAIVQNKNTLKSFSQEGIDALDTVRSFKGDASLSAACLQMLTFYKNEAEKSVPVLTKYYLVKEKFDKIKTAVESKSPSERTQADIDSYNNVVDELNKSAESFNKTVTNLDEVRRETHENWEKASDKFMSKHAP